jgi:hypothetical protein
MYQRNTEALERRRERQQREDSAPRLSTEIPALRTLRLTMSYYRGDVAVQPGHTRLVVVQRAPALFQVTCADKDCKQGGHDITEPVMRGLREGHKLFTGSAPCSGELGATPETPGVRCGSELRFEAEATFG